MASSTFSTGQTVDDFKQIADLFSSVHGPGLNFTFPALLDPHYNPPDRGPLLYSIVGLSTILATIAVILRCISRVNCSPCGKILPEDWSIIIGLVFTIASSLIIIVGVANWQYGMHIYDLRFESLNMNLKLAYIGQVIYLWATMFIRLSLLLFIRRLYREISGPMFYTCTFLCYANLLHCVAASLAYILQCTPIEAAFSVKLEIKDGICQKVALYYTFCATGMVADIILIILPIDLMRRLRIEARKRFMMLGMFGLGIIACAASIVRFAFLFKSLRSLDASWELVPTSICCALEDTMAIITSCIPAMKMLFTSSALLPANFHARHCREMLHKQDDKISSNESNELVYLKRESTNRLPLEKLDSAATTCSEATVAPTTPQLRVIDVDADVECKVSVDLDDVDENEDDKNDVVSRDATNSWFDWTPGSPPETNSDLESALRNEEALPPKPEMATLRVPRR